MTCNPQDVVPSAAEKITGMRAESCGELQSHKSSAESEQRKTSGGDGGMLVSAGGRNMLIC